MQLAVNLDTLRIHAGISSTVPLSSVELIRGATEPVELVFFRGTTPEPVTGTIKLGIKAKDDFAGDFVGYVDSWTLDEDTYSGTLSLNTTEAGTLIGTDAAADIVLEIAWGDPERSAFAVPGKLRNDIIKGDEGVPTEGSPSYPTPSQIVVFLSSVTGLTGGGATNLDGVVTVGVAVGILRAVVISGVLRIYRLQTGTNAEASPGTIRPDDYAGTTNEKVWIQVL
jgi:hypothetical protein